MSATLVIDNYAVEIEHEKTDDAAENLMFAMFSFDHLQDRGIPFYFAERYPDREAYLLLLLNELSAYYGVRQADILRDWGEYNALPGSQTYYRLKKLLDQAKSEAKTNDPRSDTWPDDYRIDPQSGRPYWIPDEDGK